MNLASTVGGKPIWILIEQCNLRGQDSLIYKTYRCATPGCRAMCTIPSLGERPPPDRCWVCGAKEISGRA